MILSNKLTLSRFPGTRLWGRDLHVRSLSGGTLGDTLVAEWRCYKEAETGTERWRSHNRGLSWTPQGALELGGPAKLFLMRQGARPLNFMMRSPWICPDLAPLAEECPHHGKLLVSRELTAISSPNTGADKSFGPPDGYLGGIPQCPTHKSSITIISTELTVWRWCML